MESGQTPQMLLPSEINSQPPLLEEGGLFCLSHLPLRTQACLIGTGRLNPEMQESVECNTQASSLRDTDL